MSKEIKLGSAHTILSADGSVWGRVLKNKDGISLSVYCCQKKKGDSPYGYERWGYIEFEAKIEERGWRLLPSYLLVTSVTYNAASREVTVSLTHNVWEGWNQVVCVPLAGNWRAAVTEELISRMKATGSETHIGNFSEMLV